MDPFDPQRVVAKHVSFFIDTMSSIFHSFLTTSDMNEVLSDQGFVAAMLKFEAAVARAQASAGLIPNAAAQSIIGTCKVDLFDVPKLARDSVRERCLISPMVKDLRETVGLFNAQAAPHVHCGIRLQDVAITATALVAQQALGLIQVELARLVDQLKRMANAHADDVMLSRLQSQNDALSSVGGLFAHWVLPLVQAKGRLPAVAAQALCVQLDGAQGPEVMQAVASELGLRSPGFAGNSTYDWVRLACELGLLTSGLGQIARDMKLLAHPASGEWQALTDELQVALTAEQRAPQRVAALMHMLALNPSYGQNTLNEWSALLSATLAALRSIRVSLDSLKMDSPQMTLHLEAKRASVSSKVRSELFGQKRVKQVREMTRELLFELNANGA